MNIWHHWWQADSGTLNWHLCCWLVFNCWRRATLPWEDRVSNTSLYPTLSIIWSMSACLQCTLRQDMPILTSKATSLANYCCSFNILRQVVPSLALGLFVNHCFLASALWNKTVILTFWGKPFHPWHLVFLLITVFWLQHSETRQSSFCLHYTTFTLHCLTGLTWVDSIVAVLTENGAFTLHFSNRVN